MGEPSGARGQTPATCTPKVSPGLVAAPWCLASQAAADPSNRKRQRARSWVVRPSSAAAPSVRQGGETH
jgi:hypothetical protein